ncbi:dapper homolog 2-like isoform X1 [Sinocyclocheilus rhinocerous]|uniref:Dapper homolog 2-like n=1 Tax=Sinocyclocheilus rhinocerous TaxID=307959 RepID=A0A673H5H4_9TELE|nr:PREDICTED: dapper homolog 2-like isoform X1 [Sinocyclocheilus rhinocerous]
MAGRRGCVNSLWSGSDRVRIGERLKGTLAGILELDLLRGRQLEMVDAVLDMNGAPAHQGEGLESAATSRRQQSLSPANPDLSCLGTTGEGISSRWSTLSWDIPSDLLSSPTPDFPGTTPLDCDSRPSSGFYSVSGSSLSDSCYSVSSEAVPGGSVKVSCRPRSLDHSATHWREAESHSTECPEDTVEKQERRPFSTGDLELNSLMFLTDLCSSLGGIHPGSLLPSSNSSPQLQLDPKFCSDLVSRKTKEVYPYPSPLHAVALQSPLFTTCQEPSPTRLSPSPESDQPVEPELEQPPEKGQPPASPSFTQLEQYINKLVHQHHCRVAAETSSRGPQINIAGAGYEWIHPRSASSSSLSGGSVTPCKSILGNSARVSLSSIGKHASRNSINLGNLPSVTGEDFNISFHLNLNLNLNPNLNKTLSVDATNVKEEVSGSCGHLSASIVTPTASPSSSTSTITSTPNWSRRPRISTCPSSVNNRGSLEITGKSFGQMGFSKSLDWSGASREEAEGCPPTKASDSPPKLNEDSAVVCEISRVSGLPRSVVLGLMEEGVELDAECFRSERERGVGSASPSNIPTRHSSCSSFQHPFGLDRTNLTPLSNAWAGAGTGQDYISQQHRLQVSHSDCHSALTSQSGSPHSDNSGPTPTRSSPILPFPHNQSDSASSPGSSHNRVHSPPRLLSNSPFTPAQLSVFRRDSPSQCSLPRFHPCSSPLGPIRPRGGSLRQNAGAGWRPQDRGWRRSGDGERLYQGKHASRELIRASTVSSYLGRDYGTGWEDEMSTETPKKGGKFWKGFETRFWGREEEEDERDERAGGFGWRHTSLKEKSSSRQDQRGNNSKKKGTSWDSRSSSLRLSRRALFRSESQGILEPHSQKRESNQWRSSFEISRAGRGSERARNLVRKEEKHHSSTASLFHLSRSQSLEGSSHSLSPLSSPSLSPSPPPSAPLTRSRSFRDLGRKVFGSMRSLSFNKNHKSKKKD